MPWSVAPASEGRKGGLVPLAVHAPGHMIMNARHCSSPPLNPPPPPVMSGRGDQLARSPLLVRAVVRMSRARWYSFLRRVFHHQNGMMMMSDSAADAGNPFNSSAWLAWELASLLVQITAVTMAMAVSRGENPVWPLRVWLAGYNLGNLLSMPVLYWRYRHSRSVAAVDDQLRHRSFEETTRRGDHLILIMNRCRTLLELFFAVWFVMGNVWVFDARQQGGGFGRAPVLHTLCLALLAWNAIGYSFPFLLFLLLCCCVPLVGGVLGYNMNAGAEDRGASDEELAVLPHWRFIKAIVDAEAGLGQADKEDSECCICLTKYDDKEDVRQLPCSHLFHLRCVDQWLKIIACCPLCKRGLQQR